MKASFVLGFVCWALLGVGQNRTNIWELSYSTDTMYPNCELRFDNGSVDTNSVTRIMSFFDTNTSICDSNGNLLFYSNGLTIGNQDYDTLQNAINFNPGGATDFYEIDGMGSSQGVLFIPDPGNDKNYYVFHESGEFFIANNTFELQPLYLSYSVVDMNLDGGLGGIVDSLKNIHILPDTLTWGGLAACKHANGRDWWVIAHRYYSDKYYKFLVTPDGIKGPFIQCIGSQIKYDVSVQATFSPDGTKFCFSNHGGWFDYMNFDRCTGMFFNSITVFSPDSLGVFGNSYSPNSRFLYISSLINLYQYDTWNSNILTDMIHVATWDTFFQGAIEVLFFMHQLAPDNKIYISPYNGASCLNVINSPDSLGLSCNFAPHSFYLPQYTNNIPTFPNYDLDSIPGDDTCSAIYTTQNNELKSIGYFRISGNPISQWLNIIYSTQDDCFFELLDIYGNRVGGLSLFHYFKNRLLNVSILPAGIYFARVLHNGKRVWSEKVIIVH